MKFTKQQYEEAIANLQLGMLQLEHDGDCCRICEDEGHSANECGFNPLVAMDICCHIAAQSDQLHDTLHQLAGYNFAFGVQLGPRKVVMP